MEKLLLNNNIHLQDNINIITNIKEWKNNCKCWHKYKLIKVSYKVKM